MVSIHIIMLLVSTLISSTLAGYTLAQDYTGANFYRGFDFFTGPDPTEGHVQFLDKTSANTTRIAGILTGGHTTSAVYLGVDTKSIAPNGRDALRVSSKQAFHHGLFVVDLAHMPGGICGTWGAFWLLGNPITSGSGKPWPADGEIDVIEQVNEAKGNQMTLHTNAGVVVNNSSDFSGELLASNCDVAANENAGCGVADNDELTFGAGFNSNGGGIYATQWTANFIKIWFFPRGSSIPSDIVSGTPNPSDSWGVPRAVFAGNFGMEQHFTQMNIIFDTTFCGQWAGTAWPTSSCAAKAPTCEEFVTNNPSAFTEAYWAINSLQVFQDNATSFQDNATTSTTLRRRSGGAVLPRRST